MNEIVKVTDYAAIVEAYLAQKDVCGKSKRTYREALKSFFRWTGEKRSGATRLTKADIIEYKAVLRARGLKPHSVNLYLTALRGFFSWAEEERLHPDVARNVKGEKIARGFKKEALTREQATELVQSMKNKRDKVLVLLMIATGLRTVEVTRANVEDLRTQQGETVLFVQGKGRAEKDDFVVIKGRVLRELQDYLIDRRARPEEPLFTRESRGTRLHPGSVSRIIKTALRHIRIDDPRITAHSLRHTMVTFAGLGGASLESRQAGARHEQQATTALYDHSRDDIRLKDEAVTCALQYLGATA